MNSSLWKVVDIAGAKGFVVIVFVVVVVEGFCLCGVKSVMIIVLYMRVIR